MSYYGVRKVKQIQKENGKWNITCEYYDSSIWTYDNKRDWHECTTGFFNTDFDTKEELEYALFKDTLDGNIHGTGGKFGCIGWNSNKIKMSEKEKVIYETLDKEYWELHRDNHIEEIRKELREKGISYSDMEEYSEEIREHNRKLQELRTKKEEFRYNTFYTKWKEYLKQQNKNRTGRTYIVKLDYNGYTNVYVGKHGTSTTTFYHYVSHAKLFKKSIEELQEMFGNKPKYKNVKFIDVTDKIEGTGRRKYLNVTYQELEKLPTIAC